MGKASINPYIEVSGKKDAEKQAYVESLVLQELVDDLDIPRDGLVVSALLTDDIVRPAGGGNVIVPHNNYGHDALIHL